MSEMYINVIDFIDLSSNNDVSDAIQNIIDSNPNKTIFFPDGKYYISKPLITPAEPAKTVSLKLDAYAQIIAAKRGRFHRPGHFIFGGLKFRDGRGYV